MFNVTYEIRQDETHTVESKFNKSFIDEDSKRKWERAQDNHPFLYLYEVQCEEVSS